MGNTFSQFFFIPKPPITEENCPDQAGRVFLVTGGYAGVGFELCKILYAHNATVWVAGRSASKADAAIAKIKAAAPSSSGSIEFLSVDLADRTTIKPAVEKFLSQAERLDVLVQNAGVMYPPEGSKDAQGEELMVGTNCLGHYLLYQLLQPLLAKTASSSNTSTVRVAWAGSIAVQVSCPQPSGIVLEKDGSGKPADMGVKPNYGATKVGNAFFAREFAKATPENGIVHVAFNPGNLATELQRHWTGFGSWLTAKFIVYPAIYGAYTELFAAISPELTPAKSGAYVYPWGRFGPLPDGIEHAMKPESGPHTGIADKFIQWCAEKTAPFA
ncbi:hypothetical protein F5Y16DRAFT_368427 [Xylariaceae sp. FL0255]|nr:hypothetical protein F5Y16DRAFT_368427 [Xylariaceae sp. FL0255]